MSVVLDNTPPYKGADIHIICLLPISSHPDSLTETTALKQQQQPTLTTQKPTAPHTGWQTRLRFFFSVFPKIQIFSESPCVLHEQHKHMQATYTYILHTHHTHPSFSIRCREHMLMAVCRTREPSVLLLTTMPSIRGPAIRSCLVQTGTGTRGRDREYIGMHL